MLIRIQHMQQKTKHIQAVYQCLKRAVQLHTQEVTQRHIQ